MISMPRNNIAVSLRVGKIGEKMVGSLLQRVGVEPTFSTGRFKDYDVAGTLDSKNFTIEVKYDLYAEKSGNIAIEIFNVKSGEPSGLMATKADIWAHITDGVYLTKVNTLKEYVNREVPHKVITCGGDNNSSMLLFREDKIFNDIFIRADELNDKELLNTLRDLI